MVKELKGYEMLVTVQADGTIQTASIRYDVADDDQDLRGIRRINIDPAEFSKSLDRLCTDCIPTIKNLENI